MIAMEVVALVRTDRAEATDDFWGKSESTLVLADALEASALDGIEAFSHAEVLFLFDRVDPESVVRGARHPRGNSAWPSVGIFAQRGKNRPNRIGSTIVRIVRREARALVVAELDAIDGTPILDIKPVMAEFLPRGAITQPSWSHELMTQYWSEP